MYKGNLEWQSFGHVQEGLLMDAFTFKGLKVFISYAGQASLHVHLVLEYETNSKLNLSGYNGSTLPFLNQRAVKKSKNQRSMILDNEKNGDAQVTTFLQFSRSTGGRIT